MTLNRRRDSAVGWSAIWALALIAGAFLFKRSPSFYWVEGLIFVGGITQILRAGERRRRCW